LTPNVVEAYRVGDKPFEFKGTNGFIITFDIDSKTAHPAAGGGL
jgi:ABC-type amino acid transport substrate-binding protein